jgi:GNAT superfamily N-acetyltransferase
VVGFIDVYRVPRLNFRTAQAWVPDLIVSGEARSRGVGAALLREAEGLAGRPKGWRGSTKPSPWPWNSANWRTRAHAFHERQGRQSSGKQFVRALKDVRYPPPPTHG